MEAQTRGGTYLNPIRKTSNITVSHAPKSMSIPVANSFNFYSSSVSYGLEELNNLTGNEIKKELKLLGSEGWGPAQEEEFNMFLGDLEEQYGMHYVDVFKIASENTIGADAINFDAITEYAKNFASAYIPVEAERLKRTLITEPREHFTLTEEIYEAIRSGYDALKSFDIKTAAKSVTPKRVAQAAGAVGLFYVLTQAGNYAIKAFDQLDHGVNIPAILEMVGSDLGKTTGDNNDGFPRIDPKKESWKIVPEKHERAGFNLPLLLGIADAAPSDMGYNPKDEGGSSQYPPQKESKKPVPDKKSTDGGNKDAKNADFGEYQKFMDTKPTGSWASIVWEFSKTLKTFTDPNFRIFLDSVKQGSATAYAIANSKNSMSEGDRWDFCQDYDRKKDPSIAPNNEKEVICLDADGNNKYLGPRPGATPIATAVSGAGDAKSNALGNSAKIPSDLSDFSKLQLHYDERNTVRKSLGENSSLKEFHMGSCGKGNIDLCLGIVTGKEFIQNGITWQNQKYSYSLDFDSKSVSFDEEWTSDPEHLKDMKLYSDGKGKILIVIPGLAKEMWEDGQPYLSFIPDAWFDPKILKP